MKNIGDKCHRCGSSNSETVQICANIECMNAFCKRCLKYRYKIDLKEISEDWQCFICLRTCSCKTCRKEAASAKSNRRLDTNQSDLYSCHQCNKKTSITKKTFCEKCKNALCITCYESLYKNLDNCPVCIDICTCKNCGDLRFNNDFPEFNKGVDLRLLYPYDLDNIFYFKGFWVRNINL